MKSQDLREIEERARAVVEHQPGETIPVYVFPDHTSNRGGEMHRFERHIDVSSEGGQPRYALVETEWLVDTAGRELQSYDPITLVQSDSASEVLRAGVLRVDFDRASERLDALLVRMKAGELEPTAQLVAESVSEGLALSVSARMRIQSDALDFLEDRLEAGDLISRTVERQERCEVTTTLRECQQIA